MRYVTGFLLLAVGIVLALRLSGVGTAALPSPQVSDADFAELAATLQAGSVAPCRFPDVSR